MNELKDIPINGSNILKSGWDFIFVKNLPEQITKNQL